MQYELQSTVTLVFDFHVMYIEAQECMNIRECIPDIHMFLSFR